MKYATEEERKEARRIWQCEYNKKPARKAQRRKYAATYRERHRAELQRKGREYVKERRGGRPARSLKSDEEKKNTKHWGHLRRKYGIASEHEWFELTKNGCGICGSMRNLVVDHDHVTGKIRGALCHQHNIGLGQFSDDPAVLRRAISWLEKSK